MDQEVSGGQRTPLTYPIGEAGRIKSIRSAEVWLNDQKGLALLTRLAGELSWVTGCWQWQAVGFLLCDLPFCKPWLSAEVVPRSSVNLETILAEAGIKPQELPTSGVNDSTLLIEVGSLFVPAEAVRDLYVEVRDQLLTQGLPEGGFVGIAGLGTSDAQAPEASSALAKPVRPRGQRKHTLELLAWVEEARAKGLSWEKLREGWNKREDAPAYLNLVSMRHSYYQARKRRTVLES